MSGRVALAEARKGDGLTLSGPVMTAAGTAGVRPLQGAHAFVTPQIALVSGRAVARAFQETPAGIVWPLPFSSLSLRAVLRDHLAAWRDAETPVIANISALDRDESREIAETLSAFGGVAAIELSFLQLSVLMSARSQTEAVAAVCRAVLDVSHLPLIAKLGPGPVTGRLARAAVDAGAGAVCIGGGPIVEQDGVLSMMCGPAVRPLMVATVREVVDAVAAPVIGSGGVTTVADARALLQAGASAVQVGSASLINPYTASSIARELENTTEQCGAIASDR